MRLQIDVSDQSWNAPGGLSLFSSFVQAVQTNVTAGNNVTIVVYDPGGYAKHRADDLMDAPLLQDKLCTCYYQTTLNVPLGRNADLTSRGPIYAPGDNWWNLSIVNAPIDPNSESIKNFVASLGNNGYLHPDFNKTWGMPYISVAANAKLFPVTFSNPDESDQGAPGRPSGYPIPEAAQSNPGLYLESSGSTDGDRHMLMVCVETGLAYELSYVSWDGTKWKAGYGAVFDINSNYRRPEGWTSTDAAGLCVLPGLIRPDEVYGDQFIQHALRCSFNKINGYVWPASHRGSSDAGAPPLGTRIRLKSSFSTNGYTPDVQKVLVALKVYGGLIADRGGKYVAFQGVQSPQFDPAVWNPAFHGITIRDFDIIKLGWKP